MKRTAIGILITVLVLVVILTSCSAGKNTLPINPFTGLPTSLSTTPEVIQTTPGLISTTPGTVLTTPVPVTYLPSPTLNPGASQYYNDVKKVLSLNSDEQSILKQNGFVVTDRLAWDRFLDAYAWIYSKDLPVLVTTDSLLHSVHQSYDDLLMDIESQALIPKLKSLLDGTQQKLNRAMTDNTDPALTSSYRDVSTYLSVAGALLYGQTPLDSSSAQLYAWANQAASIEKISLFGNERKIDFTLFKPRGHYTRSPELQRYFRAMNWLAQIDFRFVEFDPVTSQPVLRQNQITAAVVLKEAIEAASQKENWNRIDQLLQALVGQSDNTNLNDLDKLMSDLKYSSAAGMAKGDGKWIMALLQSNDYGYQRITGQLLVRDIANFSPQPVPRPISFMLMGQRFTIDSYVLGNLVYDRMIKNGQPIERALPSSLDAAYTLGNDRAYTHLSSELDKYGYAPQLSVMRQEVDSLPAQFWSSPLYNQWLGMLRALNTPTTEQKFPQSMRTGAWADKMLQTQLASWAQLRHDNLLYAKQSVTMIMSCQYPRGYVEPYPQFYQQLYDYAKAGSTAVSAVTAGSTGNWEYIRTKALAYFSNVMSSAVMLKSLAEKELTLQPFSAEEETFLKSIVVRSDGAKGCGGPNYAWDGWYVKMFYSDDKNPAVIADVHTNPNNDGPLAPARVLHAASGQVVPVCLTAETDEGSTTYVGPCFTYYDVIEQGYPPVRLTDEVWQSRLQSVTPPAHPDWTRSFLVTQNQSPQMLRQ